MYHVECIDIRKKDPMYLYLDRACLCANNMRNVANFHIRNLMTGLKKKPAERTANEVSVIKTVAEAIPEINRNLQDKYELKIRNIVSRKDLSQAERSRRIANVKCVQFEVPTSEKWFASYGLLDAVFKYMDQSDYRSFHIHVVQNAVRSCCESWKGFFESLKSLGPSSGHTGRPKIPGYRKSGGRSTAVFSNVACSRRHGTLFFPYYSENGVPGEKRRRCSIGIGHLPHASGDKLVEVRAVPCYGIYQLQIVTDDGLKEDELLPSEKDIIGADGKPAGVMTLDIGLNNFAAMADNRGNTPVVIKGGAIKACNQWFNKRMAQLRSAQMKGHDPKIYHPPATRQMKHVSRKRDAFLRDTFYKYAHCICRLMRDRGLTYLIIGYNKGQKQGIELGRRNNQAFVQVPFERFRQILKTVCVRYGIRVILQEESYTSKACFGSRDYIPTYGTGDSEKMTFTGRRIKRGLYLQDDGKMLNADINGAANIGRKYNERIFPRQTDIRYLYGKVISMTYKEILRNSQENKKSNPGQTGQRASVCPVSA